MKTIQNSAGRVGRGKRQRMQTDPNPASPSRKRSMVSLLAIALVSAGVGAGAVWLTVLPRTRTDLPVAAGMLATNAPVRTEVLSRFELLAMTSEELARVDVAEMNLACAAGLPGFEGVDRKAVLAKLDEWAARVKTETERHLYRVTDPKYADHYEHSEKHLRAEFLIQTLQEDCGVRYNPLRIYSPNFTDCGDSFIHGLLDPKLGGTCASMPVLYAAVGRRLGYPIKLVSAKEHLFCRWESVDGKDRFNIEGASSGGWDSNPDDYYKAWPKPLAQAEIDRNGYLKSMTPMEELAVFLLTRAACAQANGLLPDARASLAEAHRLVPMSNLYPQALASTFMPTSVRVPQNLRKAHEGIGPPDPTPGHPALPVPGRRP